MNTLGLTPVTSERPQPGQQPIVAIGLIASGFTAFLLVTLFKTPKGFPLLLTAVIYILLIIGANTSAIHAAGGILRRNVHGIALRTGATAAWLAPLAVYM